MLVSNSSGFRCWADVTIITSVVCFDSLLSDSQPTPPTQRVTLCEWVTGTTSTSTERVRVSSKSLSVSSLTRPTLSLGLMKTPISVPWEERQPCYTIHTVTVHVLIHRLFMEILHWAMSARNWPEFWTAATNRKVITKTSIYLRTTSVRRWILLCR